jgi:hypothetical protein
MDRAQSPAPSNKRNVRLGLILVGIAVFMFVSFVIKTALRGP